MISSIVVPSDALWGNSAVVGLLALGGVAPIPRGIVCVAAGAVLGWPSIGPAMVGNILGAVAGFLLGRHALQGFIQRFTAARPKLDAFMAAIDHEGWLLVGLLRLASPFPGPLLNFASGVSGIGFPAFLLASTIGVVPQTLLFIYVGWAGSEALASHDFWSVNTLILAAGLSVTLYVFSRLRAAARSGAARRLSETDRPGRHRPAPPSRGFENAR